MPISASESVAIILVCALCTFLERYLPFAFFERREVPSGLEMAGRGGLGGAGPGGRPHARFSPQTPPSTAAGSCTSPAT